jgi:choline-sulfatase
MTVDGAEDNERIIISQFVDELRGKYCYGIMIRYHEYKYIYYHGFEEFDMLFDLENDSDETVNIIKKIPELREWMVPIL